MAKERWWTAPTQTESGASVMVTGRDNLDKIISKGKCIYRVTVIWDYDAEPSGYPDKATSELMEQATDAMAEEFRKDDIAYMTGIYTGDGRREWVFYTSNMNIFNKVFNRALENLPVLPIVVEAEEDRDWEEYREMREISYIPEDETE